MIDVKLRSQIICDKLGLNVNVEFSPPIIKDSDYDYYTRKIDRREMDDYDTNLDYLTRVCDKVELKVGNIIKLVNFNKLKHPNEYTVEGYRNSILTIRNIVDDYYFVEEVYGHSFRAIDIDWEVTKVIKDYNLE